MAVTVTLPPPLDRVGDVEVGALPCFNLSASKSKVAALELVHGIFKTFGI
jgi:hypothetical protein